MFCHKTSSVPTQAYLTDEAESALDISGISAMRNPAGALILPDLAAIAVVNGELADKLVDKEEALSFRDRQSHAVYC
ncbi:MAG: hypothetical protein ACUVRV_07210 [Cyanobacteriota bacterium]